MRLGAMSAARTPIRPRPRHSATGPNASWRGESRCGAVEVTGDRPTDFFAARTMKLDATDVRYVTPEEFRVLTAVEMGSKNHEVVPTALIAQISSLRHAGISKLLSSLLKRKLVARVQNNVYDGFRLTYGGYDYLAVRALSKRKTLYAVGNQIGIGKESDIYIVANEEGERRVLKIHRLGRISFRKIKEKRDYMGKRKSASWMYMSRLAAEKEYAFMQVRGAH